MEEHKQFRATDKTPNGTPMEFLEHYEIVPRQQVASNRAEQSRAEQSRAEQNRTEQNRKYSVYDEEPKKKEKTDRLRVVQNQR